MVILPSASGAIIDLLKVMNEKGIDDIIVDLRKNSGGNSYLAYILAYFLSEIDANMRAALGSDITLRGKLYRKRFYQRLHVKRGNDSMAAQN